jgi:(1->4)-alpha-D-glucan 1-alpha-D-glucosylmutase
MAKGVEDTAFYRFNRLVSLNEVGGEPDRFGSDAAAFHKLNASRLPRLSRGLSSTSTHDMKRSEDVRARIHVLSEVPQLWRKQLTKWSRWNRRFRTDVEGQSAPAASDEYLFYQTLLGFWPDQVPHGDERERRIKRVQNYMLKAVREAKLHTSWISPYEPYERAVTSFVAEVLNEHRRGAFLADIQAFAQKIADHGYWNSLSQLLLKVVSPGVPDFYQGTETWSLTLVDPDNRQPIDFASSRQRLNELQRRLGADGSAERRGLMSELVQQRADGRIKLFTTLMSLRARRSLPDLFTEGDYLPLNVVGSRSEHLVALARRRDSQWAIAVAPRLTAKLCGFGGPPPIGSIWQGTGIELPAEISSVRFRDAFSGESRELGPGSIDASELLANFPLALFTGTSES